MKKYRSLQDVATSGGAQAFAALVKKLDQATGNVRGKLLKLEHEKNWQRLRGKNASTLKESTLREVYKALLDAANAKSHQISADCPTANELVAASQIARQERGGSSPPTSLAADTMPDLPQGGAPSEAALRHLGGYLLSLKAKANRHQGTGHFKELRSIIEAKASTFEALRAWRNAAAELGELVSLELKLEDYTGAARGLLRQGIALYREGEYEKSCTVLTRANEVLDTHVPKHGELRTTIKVWDYLGLAHLRCGAPTQALEWLSKADELPPDKRLHTPLAVASRFVRRGIAHMHLKDIANAHSCLMKGLKIRVQISAHAELARGLRYLGILHFDKSEWPAALCIWDACEGHQDYVNDDSAEKAKLLYYRAELFRRWALPEGEAIGDKICVPDLSKLFHTEEQEVIEPLKCWFAKTPYLRSQAAAAARINLQACVEIADESAANRKRLAWIKKNANESLRLLVSYGNSGRKRTP